MAADPVLTWEADIAYRPTADALGGDEKLDEPPPNNPPDDTHPTAGGWNQKVRQIVALGKTTRAATLYIRFSAGTPSLFSFSTCRAAVNGDFTITDLGPGATRIEWAANFLPAHPVPPSTFTFVTSVAPTTARSFGIIAITNGIEVRTWDGSTPTDVDFVVGID